MPGSDVKLPVSTYIPFFTFSFERNFDAEKARQWFENHWTVSIWCSILYVVFLWFGTKYMNTRPKYHLRAPLALWSGALAVFSIVGTVKTVPELVYSLREHGLEYSVCDPSFWYGPISMWPFLFAASKLVELGDTVFIVFRKSPLIFLHWYHHISVLMYMWWSTGGYTSVARWGAAMNYSVHALMYSYYTLKALQIRLPKWLGISITFSQIAQMIWGLGINVVSYRVKRRGDACHQSDANLLWASSIYLSYLVLFLHFFYNAYIAPKNARRMTSKSESNGSTSSHTNNNNENTNQEKLLRQKQA